MKIFGSVFAMLFLAGTAYAQLPVCDDVTIALAKKDPNFMPVSCELPALATAKTAAPAVVNAPTTPQVAPQPATPAVVPTPAPEEKHLKPWVFINGKGNTNVQTNGVGGKHWAATSTSVSSRDQSLEVTNDLAKDCPNVEVTVAPEKADYVINFNHERSGVNQLVLLAHDRVILSVSGGEIALRHPSVRSETQKACTAIESDWAAKKQ